MKNRGGKRHSKRKGQASNSHTVPVVLFQQLSAGSENEIMSCSFKVSDVLAGMSAIYVYVLNHISVELMAPTQVVGSSAWTAVDQVLAQAYGYMSQDGTLQRTPMTTWRQVGTSRPTKFSFDKSYLSKRVYAGGFVPITNINGDLMFGLHALWNSGSVGVSADLKMAMNVKVRFQFTVSQDLQITQVSNSVLSLAMENARRGLTGLPLSVPMSGITPTSDDDWEPLD